MTQSALEDKNWLEFWKQDWRIHCGAASKGGQEEVRPILEALQGPPQELREKAGVCQGSRKTATDSVSSESWGNGVEKMHLAPLIQPLFPPCPPLLLP